MPRIAYIPSKNSCFLVPGKPEEHIGNSHKLFQIERLLDLASPFPKEEDEVEGSFCCRSPSANQIARKTLFEFPANLMIPESQHNDSMAR